MTTQPPSPAAVAELVQVDRAGTRLVWRLTAGLMVAIIVIGGLLLAYARADQASSQSRAQCRADKVIAEAPLRASASSKPSPLGLSISAAFRAAYVDAGCTQGKLKPADPLVWPYLPPGQRYR